MADKVMFKLGPQTRIPANGAAVNGTFYLTSDTHRLYIGQGNNAVPINAGVTFCDNFAKLTAATTGETEQNLAGRVFFLKDTNILCVRSNGKWAQINSDTKLESALAEVVKIPDTSDGEGVRVTTQVVDSVGKAVQAPFSIKPKTGNVKVYAGKDGKTVEIGVSDGATYDLTSAEIKKKKNENDPESEEVTVEGASLVLTGSNSTTDKVDIHGVGSVSISNTANGILATGTEYTLESVTTSAQDKGFNVAVGINNGGSDNNTFFPQIKYGATPQTVDFIKDTTDKNNKTGIATLDVYTKGEVDSLFSSADAMVFKDAVDAVAESSTSVTWLPSSAENGWTYKYTGNIMAMSDAKKLNKRIDSSAGWINSGDLFIASGNEVNNSLTGDWKWIHVPAGDDERYSLGKNSKGVGVTLNVTGGLTDATAGDLVFNKDNWITLTDAYADKTTTINIGHTLVTKDASTNVTVSSSNTSDQASAGPDGNTTLEIPVITPTVDAAGHITSLSQITYKVIDSHNRLNKGETSLTVAGSNGTIKITPKIVMGDGETSIDANMAFSLKSESLTLTTADKVITAELEWGQF